MIKRYSEWEKQYELTNRSDMSHKDFIAFQVSMAMEAEPQDKLDSGIGILKDAISSKDDLKRLNKMEKALETIRAKNWAKTCKPARRRCWRKYDPEIDAICQEIQI